MNLQDNHQFIKILEKYNICNLEENQSYEVYFKEKFSKIEKEYFYLPVLGVQGAGKSTLLNALLMDDIVLPVDADETTCIPVEVHYGTERKIKVIFQDKKTIECKVSDIEQYVHNAYNPGNEKKVAHIEIYQPHELLKNNVVLVDLPGVGSLTPSNVRVTMEYVEKLSAAIFVLRSIPPLTKSDALFVKTVWSKLSKAWFVQNRWNDETPEEVEEAKESNYRILESLAREIKVPKVNEIIVINNYAALNGKLERNASKYAESGINDLKDIIIEAAKDWKNILAEDFTKSLKILASETKTYLEDQLKLQGLSTKDILKKQREVNRRIDEQLEENETIIKAITDKIANYQQEMKEYASEVRRTQESNLRNEMRNVIRGGVVDGVLLSRAFEDHQKNISNDVMEDLITKIDYMQQDLQQDLGKIKIITNSGQAIGTEEFYKKEKFKMEKVLPAAGNILGGLGGIAVLGAVGGPLGIVAALGITLVGGWLGSKGKQVVVNERKKVTLSEIEEPIKRFAQELSSYIDDTISQQLDVVNESLSQLKQQQQEELEQVQSRERANIRERKEKVANYQEVLETDLNYIKQLLGEV